MPFAFAGKTDSKGQCPTRCRPEGRCPEFLLIVRGSLPGAPPAFPYTMMKAIVFNNYHTFHIYSLRKTLTSFVFNNFCSGPKVDIFSTCVFNNFCRLTFKFNPPFFSRDRHREKLTCFISITWKPIRNLGIIAKYLYYHQHSLRKTLIHHSRQHRAI